MVMQLCPNGDLQSAALSTEPDLEDRVKWILQVGEVEGEGEGEGEGRSGG